MDEVKHSLELAKPRFLYFIRNMGKELAKWVQYKGVEEVGDNLYFKFESSQNSLSFRICAGVNMGDKLTLLRIDSNDIYEYFRDLKYENI